MGTSFYFNGVTEYDVQDWAASIDYVSDQERHVWPRDQRTPCQNSNCDQLCESLYCGESCREAVEGPDHEIALDEASRGTMLPFAPALGEAPVSMNVHIPVCGRDVLVTLRGTDEQEVLARLETLLQRYPVETRAHPDNVSMSSPTQPSGQGWCAIHQVAMKLNEKAGRQWYSHKVGEGWCKGRKGGNHG